MQALEKRIAMLELKTREQEPFTIIRMFVVPSQIRREIERLTDGRGAVWHRLPVESEEGLTERASLGGASNTSGVALLKAAGGTAVTLMVKPSVWFSQRQGGEGAGVV